MQPLGPPRVCVSALIVCALLLACAQARIDQKVLIDVWDTRVYAEIRGKRDGAPVLLYLHGGPGSPLGVPVFRAYGGRLLEERFIVVYLHQRGIMKSPRVPDGGHRIERYVEDVHRVVAYLEGRFPGRRISLLGHSWGGVLAYLYTSSRPHPIHKLVTVGAPVHVEATIRGRVAMILEWARENGNDTAVRELSQLQSKGVLDDPQAFRALERWSPRAHGGWARRLSRERIDAAIDYEESIPRWLREQKRIEELMRDELLRVDLREDLKRIEVPLLCILGTDDVNTPWSLIREQIESYGGPVDLRVFEDSHHMPFIDEEALFVETVARFLLDPGDE